MNHKRIVKHVANHIVATKHNGFIPHILKEPTMWAMLGAGLALFVFTQITRITVYQDISAEIYPSVVVTLTNKDREKAGLASLSVNESLVRAAKMKAEDMARNEYFAHTSPTGLTPWHWFREIGYMFMHAGENLAINFKETDSLQEAWLNSPTHKANIMSPYFTEIGVATAQGFYNGVETTYVVEMFGTPAVSKTQPVVPMNDKPTKPKPISVGTKVAGESTQNIPEVKVVEQSKNFVAVENLEPNITPAPVSYASPVKLPWYQKILLSMEDYVGVIVEVVVILLILATASITTREMQKHHRMHMAYGILMTIILTSSLYVGRIGVFAEASTEIPVAQYID